MPTSLAWESDRLSLHVIPLDALAALREGQLDATRLRLPHLTFDTDFATSASCRATWHRRYRQVTENTDDAVWVTRLVAIRTSGQVIGRAGFHGRPDDGGMVEIGYAVDPAFHGRGYAKGVVALLVDVARQDPQVKVVRASVAPDNAASQHIVRRLGFQKVGEQTDPDDGLEEVLELPVKL